MCLWLLRIYQSTIRIFLNPLPYSYMTCCVIMDSSKHLAASLKDLELKYRYKP